MRTIGPLRYVYAASTDVDADTRFQVEALGGELRWFINRFGARVSCVRHGDGPDLILASHMQPGSAVLLHETTDFAAFQSVEGARRVETPIGSAVVFGGSTPIHIGALRITRANRMEEVWAEPGNLHAVRPDWLGGAT